MKRLIASIAAALACACGGSGSSLSFSVTTRAAAGSATALTVASNIDVQRVRLNIGRLKLEGPAVAGTSVRPSVDVIASGSDDNDAGSEDRDGGEVEFRQGPFVIDLDAAALTGAVTKVFDASVPAGTYEEFRFDVLPGAALANSSAVVDGTIDGQPFTFTSTLVASQKKEGSFVVGPDSANITLLIDPTRWFGTAASRLDPRLESNRPAIESAIRSSLDVFQDDDRSGHENHHGSDH
jgi:hypothetical protein